LELAKDSLGAKYDYVSRIMGKWEMENSSIRAEHEHRDDELRSSAELQAREIAITEYIHIEER
jgi:hypothetical protein